MATTLLSRLTGQAQVVPVITEWTAYTPTGSWTTNTTYIGKKRRVGSTMEYDVVLTVSGAPNAVPLSINQPSGETLVTTNSSPVMGYGNARKPGVDSFGITARSNNTTSVNIYIQNIVTPPSAAGSNNSVSITNPFTFASGDQIQIRYSCEIVELQGLANVAQGAGLATTIRAGLVQPRRPPFAIVVSSSGWTTENASGIYYQDQAGGHRLKFGISGTVTVTPRSTFSVAIAGLTFKYRRACASYAETATGVAICISLCLDGEGTIYFAHASASTNYYAVSGDVELEAKPSWA